MNADIRKKFFENTSETGRFIVTSPRTGKSYWIETFGPERMADWGSYNPASGKVEQKKGAGKYTGSIHPSESLITEENGFKNIWVMPMGCSPFAEIERRDQEYYDAGVRPQA